MFMIQGPQSPSIMASFLFGIQINVNFIVGLITYLRENGVATAESIPEAEEAWSRFCQALAERTLILKTESFWTGANIASKPRPEIITVYMGGVKIYADRQEKVKADGYGGFAFEPDPRSNVRTFDEKWVQDKVTELLGTLPATQG
jgi:hypothetical protein